MARRKKKKRLQRSYHLKAPWWDQVDKQIFLNLYKSDKYSFIRSSQMISYIKRWICSLINEPNLSYRHRIIFNSYKNYERVMQLINNQYQNLNELISDVWIEFSKFIKDAPENPQHLVNLYFYLDRTLSYSFNLLIQRLEKHLPKIIFTNSLVEDSTTYLINDTFISKNNNFLKWIHTYLYENDTDELMEYIPLSNNKKEEMFAYIYKVLYDNHQQTLN